MKPLSAPAAAPSKHSKLRTLIEREIKACHGAIVRLKGEIDQRQDEIRAAERKLPPLRALLDAYRDLALPAPERPRSETPAPVSDISVKTGWPGRPEAEEAPDDDDFEPVEADFNQIVAWASVRNLPFKSWDDLRAINARREHFELPPFKRRLGVKT